MLHVRKTPTKEEKKQYQEWLENHKRTLSRLSAAEKTERSAEFWANQRKLVNAALTSRSEPVKIVEPPKVESKVTDRFSILKDLDEDQREELRLREEAAQREIELKKQRVAPLCNKGGLQYITDEQDFKTMGRKI